MLAKFRNMEVMNLPQEILKNALTAYRAVGIIRTNWLVCYEFDGNKT
jgi:hypothetical protein